MKKLVLTVGTLLAVMSAYAQSNVIVTNSVTGSGNTSSIIQTMQVVYGADNNASVTILGDNNSAKLKQTGGGLVSTTTQTGNTNESDVTQMGAYSANSVFQTATNGATNKSVVSSNGQGIVSQVYQQADGAGSGNDMKLDQTGNNSYVGSQQNATGGGKNKVDWKQTGYDAVGNQGSQANIIQNASGMSSMNTLTGTQNVGFAEGEVTSEMTQTATAGGVNVATVNQAGTYAYAYMNQTADGAGSKNTATINQDNLATAAFYTDAHATQEALAGGVNEATITMTGTGDYHSADVEQYADGAGSKNTATVLQEGVYYDDAYIGQDAYAGGVNIATVNQGTKSDESYAVVNQYANGAGSSNTATVTQNGANNTSYDEAYIEQEAYTGGKNTATVEQHLIVPTQDNEYADVEQTADGAGSENTATIVQDGEDNDEAYIDQNAYMGGKNTATITQLRDADNENADVYQYATDAGSSNTATITQQENEDDAYVEQYAYTGASNTAVIEQNITSSSGGSMGSYANIYQEATGAGSKNMATIKQEGDDQSADISQNATTPSSENEATITQNGLYNTAYVEQGAASADSKNTATITQANAAGATGNDAQIYQTAVVDGKNEATIGQTGDNNKARIDQRDNSFGVNKGTITQLGDGNQAFINQLGTNNTATEIQTGMNNTAIFNQTGTGNTASSDQMGDNNSFNFTQIGDGNTVTVTQTGNGQVGGVTTVMGNGNTTIISQN